MCKFLVGSEFIDMSVISLKDIFPIFRHSLIAFNGKSELCFLRLILSSSRAATIFPFIIKHAEVSAWKAFNPKTIFIFF